MKLGFIGTGKITSAVITGICSSSITYKKIISCCIFTTKNPYKLDLINK